jgi:pyruvate formate lyase activating enzyme
MGCGRCIEACDRGAISSRGGELSTDPAKCILCAACVEACPTGAREILGRRVTVPQLMAEIERDVIFYDQSGGGVTFSGGEPLVQTAFLKELLIECRSREIHTALDTACYAPPEVIETISPYVDLLLVDLKHMDPAAHERLTGASNELILHNLRRLAQRRRQIIIRVPVIPGVNDDDANVAATGEFVASLGGVTRVDLLPHHEAARAKLARLAGQFELRDAQPPGGRDRQAGHRPGTAPQDWWGVCADPIPRHQSSPKRSFGRVGRTTGDQIKRIAGRLAGFGLKVKIGG